MKLTTVQVREFRSIDNSEPFHIGDITCLVGKNESGKTALLHALYRMNPLVEADDGYSLVDDYPRVSVEDYKQDLAEGTREPATVTEAHFVLDDADIEALRTYLGESALGAKDLKVTRGYEGKLRLECALSEASALKGLIGHYHCCPTNFSVEQVEFVRFSVRGVRSEVRAVPAAVFGRTG